MTDRGKKIREAFQKKYGVDHPSQLQSVKDKIKRKRENGAYSKVREKMVRTNLEKYGVEFFGNIEKGKKTKLEKYGNENYNNREKLIETNLEKYGSKVSPNTLKSTIRRSQKGEIGFKSKKYKDYLDRNNVKNVSQIDFIKSKKLEHNKNECYKDIVCGNRLSGMATAKFTQDEYTGTEYDKMYKFECCKCKNEFEDNLYSGNVPRCLSCYPHNKFSSIGQLEIQDFIKKELNLDVDLNNRKILNGLELDLLIPQKNIAIEFNGVYWHSEISGNKLKNYHLEKTRKCEENGIELLHIFDQEWLEKKDIIKSIISTKLGVGEKAIYARSLFIKEIPDSDKRTFLIKNHIQGNDKSKIRIALVNEQEEIQCLMTFCKSRYNKLFQYEMSRFCNKLNTRISGGASKLFSYFIKKYNPISIISYSDKRLFSGKVYSALNMNRGTDSPPSYHYVKEGKIIGSRIMFQKHKLKSIIPIFDEKLTEWENMKANGFDRIWDCGNSKYIWNR